MVRSQNVLLFVCWILVFVALIANAATKFVNLQALIENDRWVAHTHQVKERLNSLLTRCVETESGVRGYVITGDKTFLKPFEVADDRLAEEFRSLTELVQDNPERLAAIAELRRLRDRHREFMMNAIAAFQAGGTEDAVGVAKTGQGNALMDQIRQRIATMLAAEERLLVERGQLASDRYRQALIAGAVGTALSLAVTGLALWVVWQELRYRRAAETALKTQAEEASLNAERFRLLTETAPIRIWISRPDGAPVFLNRSWQEYTGQSGDAIDFADWLTAFHPDDAERLQSMWAKPDNDSKALQVREVRLRRAADQSYRWHRCAVVPVRTRSGVLQSWVGTLTDIQIQKDQAEALEQEVHLRTQELRRANNALNEEIIERTRAEERVHGVAGELRRSNEELEKFAYVASHDLQEPLRKILAFGDRLDRKSRDRLDEQSQDYLDRMLKSAARMRTLIDDLLAFSRVATNLRPYVQVDLNVILAGVVADLEATLAQSHGHIEAQALPTIEADEVQMRQLVQNLVGNALKFVKPGEAPVVSIEAARLEDLSAAAIPPAPGFPGWRLTFRDRGIGFDQVHENRIFEVFQRLHGRDHYEGTGIGLAICRKIVERHGGVIHATGQLGVGATFTIDLPDAPPAAFVVPS